MTDFSFLVSIGKKYSCTLAELFSNTPSEKVKSIIRNEPHISTVLQKYPLYRRLNSVMGNKIPITD